MLLCISKFLAYLTYFCIIDLILGCVSFGDKGHSYTNILENSFFFCCWFVWAFLILEQIEVFQCIDYSFTLGSYWKTYAALTVITWSTILRQNIRTSLMPSIFLLLREVVLDHRYSTRFTHSQIIVCNSTNCLCSLLTFH